MGLLEPHAGHHRCVDGGEIVSMSGTAMANPFTSHPASVGETYVQHLRFAARFGARMLLGGAAATVHAVFPFLFVTTASRINDELIAMRAASRGRIVRVVDVETMQPLDYHI